MAKVRKAVITAAGRGTRQYPASTAVQKEMFPLVDRDGILRHDTVGRFEELQTFGQHPSGRRVHAQPGERQPVVLVEIENRA